MLKISKIRPLFVFILAFIVMVSSFMISPVNADTSSNSDGNTSVATIQTGSTDDKISMDVRDCDIRDILSALAVTMGTNIVFTEEPVKVNFSIQDVTVTQALEYLVKSVKCDYIKSDSTLIIGSKETLTKDFASNLSLSKISLKYIKSDVIAIQIESLGIDVKKITLDTNKNALWVQGLPKDLAKVRELVNMLDKSENASSDQNTTNLMLTPLTMTYITAEQMNDVLQEMGVFGGIVLDSNPKTLWVYADNHTLNEITAIKTKVDVSANAQSDSFLLIEKKMNFLSTDEIIPILMQLEIDVNPITFGRKRMTVWLNGSDDSIKLASSVIDTFDVKENMNDNVFFVHKLDHITAKEAQTRLEYLKMEDIKTYTFGFPEFNKSIMVFCPSDFKLYVMSHLNKMDVQTEKIKVPIDYSDVATGMSRLQQRRDILVNLTGVTTSAFTISTNIARDDGFHYIMYLEETSEVIQRVKDMIRFIDDPLSYGSEN